MCGVSFVSFSPDSKVSRRGLANALLTEIESRGWMASGYAWSTPDGDVGFYKAAERGSQLSLKALPKDASNIILHTRLATQGPIEVNSNNHPVLSPEQNIALVHNGVIWNDSSIRRSLVLGDQLAEVDTAVIPALIEEKGVDGLQELMGDAAIGWIDSRDAKVLHVARIEHSPVAITWLEDGTMVAASTPSLLAQALDRMDLNYEDSINMNELEYLQFTDGEIVNEQELPQPKGFRYGYAASTRGATSGGSVGAIKSSTGGSEDGFGPGNIPRPGGIGSSFFAAGRASGWDSHWDDEVGDFEWSKTEWDDATENDKAMALSQNRDFFYMVTHWGDYTSYETLEEVEEILKSYAQLNIQPTERMFPGIPIECQWIERIGDIGYIDNEEGTDWSWVADANSMEDHMLPSYISEGAHYLQKFGAIV